MLKLSFSPKGDRVHLIKTRWIGLFFLFSFFSCSPAFCQPSDVAVVYPNAPAPYDKVFNSLIEGIKQHPGTQAYLYPVSSSQDEGKLAEWVEHHNIKGIIALGKQGYLATQHITKVPVIVGALRLNPSKISGISLAADPNYLLRQLKLLHPQINRLFVVYSQERNDWIIQLAQQAAQQQGFTLNSFPVRDLRQAVHHYRDIIKQMDNRHDAIWLPMDPIASDSEVVLPLLLQASWDRDLVLISSTPSHVQRGALFSLYPDHVGLGTDLAEMVDTTIANRKAPGIKPLTALNLAVNLRTATHLGLTFTSEQEKNFSLMFPTR